MGENYILGENHEIVPCDLMTWARWLEEDRDCHRVGLDIVNGWRVSTVFLGLDHRFGDYGPPIVFETMVFKEEDQASQYMRQYCTWDEAKKGHDETVEMAKVENQTWND